MRIYLLSQGYHSKLSIRKECWIHHSLSSFIAYATTVYLGRCTAYKDMLDSMILNDCKRSFSIAAYATVFIHVFFFKSFIWWYVYQKQNSWPLAHVVCTVWNQLGLVQVWGPAPFLTWLVEYFSRSDLTAARLSVCTVDVSTEWPQREGTWERRWARTDIFRR